MPHRLMRDALGGRERLRLGRRFSIALLVLTAWVGTFALPAGAQAAIQAGFTFEPGSPLPGVVVTFTSTSQPGDGNTIIRHQWDLDGNGSLETDTGSSPTATHTYSSPAALIVRLVVRDDAGGRAGTRHPVVIGGGAGQGPSASFAFSPSAPVAGQPVLFTSTSSDPDGEITGQAWDLDGDANFDNGGGATALRTFATAGSYVVGLRVTDSGGNVAFDSQTVTVGALLGTSTKPSGTLLRLLSPFPVVRIAGRILRGGTLIRLLSVDAPPRAKVAIRCSGRGCPFARRVRTARRAPMAWATRRVRVRRLERFLRAGVVIKVSVTRPDAIGKYTRLRIRGGKPPARVDRCLNPGSSRPVRCPSA